MLDKLKKLNDFNFEFVGKNKFYYLVIVFFIASIVGWIYEVLFYLLFDGVLVNRGFLYGFYVPVYGMGALLIVILLKRFKKNLVIFFVLTMIVTGVLEYAIGALMFGLYHKTWWSYDGLFLNINGYVCLRSVVSFAVGGLLLIYVVEPLIAAFCYYIGKAKLAILAYSIIGIFIIDLVCTLMFRHPL